MAITSVEQATARINEYYSVTRRTAADQAAFFDDLKGLNDADLKQAFQNSTYGNQLGRGRAPSIDGRVNEIRTHAQQAEAQAAQSAQNQQIWDKVKSGFKDGHIDDAGMAERQHKEFRDVEGVSREDLVEALKANGVDRRVADSFAYKTNAYNKKDRDGQDSLEKQKDTLTLKTQALEAEKAALTGKLAETEQRAATAGQQAESEKQRADRAEGRVANLEGENRTLADKVQQQDGTIQQQKAIRDSLQNRVNELENAPAPQPVPAPVPPGQTPPTGGANPPPAPAAPANKINPEQVKGAVAGFTNPERQKVAAVQEMLKAAGYDVKVDGMIGPQTRKILGELGQADSKLKSLTSADLDEVQKGVQGLKSVHFSHPNNKDLTHDRGLVNKADQSVAVAKAAAEANAREQQAAGAPAPAQPPAQGAEVAAPAAPPATPPGARPPGQGTPGR